MPEATEKVIPSPQMRCALILLLAVPLSAGTFVCNPNCLSKLASGSTMLLNADKAVSGSKKVAAVASHPFHPKRALQRLKKSKGTK